METTAPNSLIAAPSTQAVPRTMRAVLHRTYGEPDVLTVGEVAMPSPREEEVLVQVHAAGVSIGDHHVVTGKPYLIRVTPFGGLPGPKNHVPGTALAGKVVAIGTMVTGFRVGDEVMGQAPNGAFAQYAVVPMNALALKPSNASFEEAAATPWGATALQGLRDAGKLRAGQHVLVNGASGGVGTWAVQIAKALGAHVTAVCSGKNAELLRSLGADAVIDYAREDFTAGGARFDLVFDLVGNRKLSEILRSLTPKGTYVSCSGGGGDWFGPILWLIGIQIRGLFSSQRMRSFMQVPKRDDLLVLKTMVESGKARPVLDRTCSLAEVGGALRHVGAGHSRGQTVVRIA